MLVTESGIKTAASDEQPFVDFLRNETGLRVVSTDALRADYSTSGVELRSETCGTASEHPQDCAVYRGLRDVSVHKGMPEASPYQKGLDVVVDVLLLSRCELFFKSRGSVSAFPARLNPELEVVDLVDAYRQKF